MPELAQISCPNCGSPMGSMDTDCPACGSKFEVVSTIEDIDKIGAGEVVKLFFEGDHTSALIALQELADKKFPLSADQRDFDGVTRLKRCELYMQVASFLKANKDKVPKEKAAVVDGGLELYVTPYDEVLGKQIMKERGGIVNSLVLALKVDRFDTINKLKTHLDRFNQQDRNKILALLESLESEFPKGSTQREYSAATSVSEMTVVDKLAHTLGNERNAAVTEQFMMDLFNQDSSRNSKDAFPANKSRIMKGILGLRNLITRQ